MAKERCRIFCAQELGVFIPYRSDHIVDSCFLHRDKINMVENGFSPRFGFLWGVVFPWVVSAPLLYMPDVLANLINLTSLVFVSFTDFIIPLKLYIDLQRMRRDGVNVADADSILALDGQPLRDVHAHYAIPKSWPLAATHKISIAVLFMVVLTLGSIVAFTLTIQQGSYAFDRQTCALVGN